MEDREAEKVEDWEAGKVDELQELRQGNELQELRQGFR